jgi:hypothetical protein
MKPWLAMSMLLTVLVAPSLAQADDKADCIAGFEAGQKLGRSGKLTAALRELARCARDVCPRSLQTACVELATQTASLLPSIVLSATDPAHIDVNSARVTADGTMIAQSLDGRPIPIDPGPHTFRFEAPGMEAVERQMVVKAGQKAQSIVVELFPLASPSSQRVTGGGNATRRWIGIGAAAAGVVGVGVGSALGVVAFNDWSNAQSQCRTTGQCGVGSQANATRSSGETAAVGSTTAFIVGGVFVAAGAVLFLTARAAPVSLAVAPSADGARLIGTF